MRWQRDLINHLRRFYKDATYVEPETHRQTSFGRGVARIFYFVSGGLIFVLFMRARSGGLFQEWPGYLAVLLLAAAIAQIGQLVSQAQQKYQQGRRDQRADDIATAVKARQHCEYSLYLRGFSTTGKLPEIRATHQFELLSSRDIFVDLETLAAEAFEPFAPLIALGKRGEQIGAGRVQRDDQYWQRDLELLARNASFIFVLPGDSVGAVWEIEWLLKSELIEKCVFLMPPEDKHFGWAKEWARIAAKLEQLDFRLPTYRPCGMVFKMGRHRQVELLKALDRGLNAKIVGEHTKNLLRGMGDNPAGLSYCPSCGWPYRPRKNRNVRSTCGWCMRKLPRTVEPIAGDDEKAKIR